ncbi:MAG: threonine/serine exporter family protein [Firmicutes bacterium]|nr:threonine/serine exporter family protein [Bacillota bacterium]
MSSFVLSMIATMAFAVLYQIPRKAIIPVGLLGGVAYLFQTAAMRYGMTEVVASFVASLSVCLLSEGLARRLRMPVTVFAVPGIVILVPGIDAYMAMKAFVQNHELQGVSLLSQTALVAGAIASGLVISGVLFRSVWRVRHYAGRRSGD